MKRRYTQYNNLLKESGSVYFTKEQLPITNEEWQLIETISNAVKYEKIELSKTNEKHNVYVARMIYDQYDSYIPHVVDTRMQPLNHILLSKKLRTFYEKVFGYPDVIIPRCQFNKLKQGGYLSEHTDGDANPYCLVTAILYLSDDYGGGELCCSYDRKKNSYKPEKNSMILLRSIDVPHYVEKITKGCRKALVFFLTEPYAEVKNIEYS